MNETCNVTTALSAFSSISLEEMSTIRLMNRTDTKYIVSLSALMDVLQRASNCYRVQEVQGERNIVITLPISTLPITPCIWLIKTEE